MSHQPPLALRWSRLTCDAIYFAKMPPTIAARALAMVHTAMYDAWTAYSGGCEVSTTTGARLKRPDEECTRQNRETAFSYAAYRVLKALFGDDFLEDRKDVLATLMKEARCKAGNSSMDPTTPEGIGNLSAELVIDCRRGDGSNQDEKYADYTGYCPVNAPPPKRPLEDPEKWQPQRNDKKEPQVFTTPHWGLVKPFALTWGGQFRPPAPSGCGSAKFHKQVEDLIQISACLTDEQKLIAEYWAGMHEDKFENSSTVPGYGYWTVPPAQCCRIADFIAVKNEFKNTSVIKLLFAVSNALLDASIAAWDAKVYYDFARPDSTIHELYDNYCFDAWGGPCEGAVNMQGENWCPYLLTTPPFAEYPSGHSTFSRAIAEVITRLCGTNEYGDCITFPANSSVIEPKCTPCEEITLSWRTLHEAADQAGWSRRYGGIHFEEGDLRGRELGREVADCVVEKALLYFEGKLG